MRFDQTVWYGHSLKKVTEPYTDHPTHSFFQPLPPSITIANNQDIVKRSSTDSRDIFTSADSDIASLTLEIAYCDCTAFLTLQMLCMKGYTDVRNSSGILICECFPEGFTFPFNDYFVCTPAYIDCE